MNHSAALMVKRSAAQLRFYLEKRLARGQTGEGDAVDFGRESEDIQLLKARNSEKFSTENQQKGNAFADAASHSPFVEMRGVRKLTGQRLNFVFVVDEMELRKNGLYLFEHKWLEHSNGEEDWFFHVALIQTAFYGALAEKVNVFNTAWWKTTETKQVMTVPEGKRRFSCLNFGGQYYMVDYTSTDVLKFFTTKAKMVELGFREAKLFDEQYHQKEWEKHFKGCIRFRRWKRE